MSADQFASSNSTRLDSSQLTRSPTRLLSDHRWSSKRFDDFNQDEKNERRRSTKRLTLSFHEALSLCDESGVVNASRYLLARSKCLYPMYALPIAEALQLKAMPDHQTLLNQGKLVVVKETDKTPVVFLSHQWTGFDSADPHFTQFKIFQKAVRSIRAGYSVNFSVTAQLVQALTGQLSIEGHSADLPSALMDCLVFYDYASAGGRRSFQE